MMDSQRFIERRLRVSGALVLIGLLVEVVTLRWAHPIAFLTFALVGIPVVLAGVVWFLYSLVTMPESTGKTE